MMALYFLLGCLLLIALGIVAFAFKRDAFSGRFMVIALLMTLSATGIYYLVQPPGLKNWLAGGREHYQLMVQFEQLGGVKGAIASITMRLTNDPENIQAWIILGKLYLADHNEPAARAAFARARELQRQK